MKLRITAHALLRYLERVKGVNVEAARLEMVKLCEPYAGKTHANAVIHDGQQYLFNEAGDVIVTVRSDTGPTKLTRERFSSK